MQVKYTYIVSVDGIYKRLYETFDGKYWMETHLVGQMKEVTLEEAIKLTAK